MNEESLVSNDLSSESKGKVVCLVSGGIDSPVAAWLMIRRGCTPIFLHFNNHPFEGDDTKQKAFETIRRLSKYTSEGRVKVYVVYHGEDLKDIQTNCPRRLTCVLCKRMMYRLGEEVAKLEGAKALITGEIIGEHASQTLRNLHIISEVLKNSCLLRPLAGMDKLEVEHLARKIGTFEISTKPASSCSAVPSQPRTKANIEEILKAEKRLDIPSMINRDLSAYEVLII